MDPTDSDDDPESPGEGERVLSGEVTSSTMVVKGGSRPKVFLQGSSNSSSDDVENSDENDKGGISLDGISTLPTLDNLTYEMY